MISSRTDSLPTDTEGRWAAPAANRCVFVRAGMIASVALASLLPVSCYDDPASTHASNRLDWQHGSIETGYVNDPENEPISAAPYARPTSVFTDRMSLSVSEVDTIEIQSMPFDGSGMLQGIGEPYAFDPRDVRRLTVENNRQAELVGIPYIYGGTSQTNWRNRGTDPEIHEDTPEERELRLASLTRDIYMQIMHFQPGLLKMIGMDSIALADSYERYLATFDWVRDQVSVELDYDWDEDDIRGYIIGHEVLGHGLYDYLFNDMGVVLRGFEENIFIEPGHLGSGHTHVHDSEYLAPEEFYSYGPNRRFFSGYSATNFGEHFAEIARYTFEVRGLIMPGDADYGSPLQKDQGAYISYIEQIFPGVGSYLEQATTRMRMAPENVVNKDVHLVDVYYSDVNAWVEDLAGRGVSYMVYSSRESRFPKMVSSKDLRFVLDRDSVLRAYIDGAQINDLEVTFSDGRAVVEALFYTLRSDDLGESVDLDDLAQLKDRGLLSTRRLVITGLENK